MSYHQRYIGKLQTLAEVRGRDVAVFGCSFGYECQLLIEAGANSVTGFDLDPKVGRSFSHPSVEYHQRSVADTGMRDEQFDIIYSAAVFEHVQDIKGGYQEAIRICKTGGTMMILSSPIWHSPYGNHMVALLENMPWCHLLYTPKQLVEQIQRLAPQILDKPGEVDRITETIFDPAYFNRYPAMTYVSSVNDLEGVNVMSNAIWKASVKPEYERPFLEDCLKSGFVETDLMAAAHFFHGKK